VTHSSISFQNDGTFEETASDFGFNNVASSAMYSAARDENSNNAVQAIKSGNGVEVITAVAKCLTYDVSIAFFERKKFTRDFFFGLLFLNRTLEQSESEQLTAYSRFTTAFGTHFIRKADMGASMSFQKVFTTRSKGNSAQKSKKDCFIQSAEKCIREPVFVESTAKACISTKSKEWPCSWSANTHDNSDSSITIATRGSTPKENIKQWLDSDFKPYPILVKLEPIGMFQ
jgi:hypothetical protein